MNLTKKKNRCMRKQTLLPFVSFFVFFYIPIFMIGKKIGAAAATPAAPVPTPMQFYAVFQSLSCRRHVDNSCRMPPATPTRGYDVSK